MKLYKRHLKWTNEFVKNNISIIEKNYSLYPSRTQWNNMTVYDKESHKFVDIWEDVHSVHDYEMKDIYRIDYKFLRQQYTKVTEDVTREYGLEKYGISDIWYNYYKKGQYQIPHKHLGPYNDNPPGGLSAIPAWASTFLPTRLCAAPNGHAIPFPIGFLSRRSTTLSLVPTRSCERRKGALAIRPRSPRPSVSGCPRSRLRSGGRM